MTIKKFAPVLIPTLNRYEHLKQCLDSLANNTHASKTLLYIALDAPAKEEHKKGYNRIIKYLGKISGFKKVIVIKRDKNFGIPKNVLEAQKDLFKKYDGIIVSEDDNYFSPNFLDYMNKGLQLFKNRKDIFAVCGYNFPIDIPPNYPYNFCLFKVAAGWGIGLWRNKHNRIDLSVRSVERFLENLGNILKVEREANYLLPHLFDMVNKNFVAADTIYSMDLVKNNMFCVLPTVSKVRNCGHDGTGIHTAHDGNDFLLDQTIDSAKYFDFSDPVENVTENMEISRKMQNVSVLRYPNTEVLILGLIFLTRKTNLLKYYRKVKKKVVNILKYDYKWK